MKNIKFLLGALSIAALMTGCPTNPPPAGDAGVDTGTGGGDGGRDTGPTPDTGMGDGGGVDMGVADTGPGDSGVAVDCTTYCTMITSACTTTNAQYADMTACMTACTNAGWVTGNATDTAGNTLGCRIYHAGAAAGNAALHCPHAGPLGGAGQSTPGPCSPFRQDPAVEGHPTATEGAYVRVDRMGMPAVATALVGPGTTTPDTGLTLPQTIAAHKDAYNDSNPSADATFASAPQMLTAIGAFHFLLDADLRSLGMTPCSVTHSFPAGLAVPVPACAVQRLDGFEVGHAPGLAGTVASLIVPDTLRIDQSAATAFPNGRHPSDDVINPTLSVLLLALTPCAGDPNGMTCSARTTMASCGMDTSCTWNGTSCGPAATSITGLCRTHTTMATCLPSAGCSWTGTVCNPIPCEALPVPRAAATTQCAATIPGCVASTCGTGTLCTPHSLDGAGLTPHMGDAAHAIGTTFPYFAMPN